jgi:transcriptional regulator GlxA family with amidase domain
MSVTDYLMRLRIGEACAMLSGTNKPVAFIADAVGYNSLANFNRQFKSMKHITPRDYRMRFRSAA